MNPQELLEWLEAHDACTEAREWVAGKTLQEAWEQCTRPSWIVWLCGTLDITDDVPPPTLVIGMYRTVDYIKELRAAIPYSRILDAVQSKLKRVTE